MSGAGTETGFAEVNGTRLYYELHGRGPALLLLHGFTLDHRMWRPQIAALSDRFRVLAYDARGFGRSAAPGSTPYRHCDDAAALCAHLGLPRVVAIGHSIGAHQTLELALDRPELVAGWISICMAGLAGVPFPEEITTMFANVRRAGQARQMGEARDLWRRCAWFTASRESAAVAAALDEMIDDYTGWHWQHDNPARSIVPPAAERLSELQAPALVVSGGRDLAYNGAIADKLAAEIRGATELRLPSVGHMANLEAPSAVNAAIADLAARCG
jgi:pimeloyl-ACP methyl ester carboxylesterase